MNRRTFLSWSGAGAALALTSHPAVAVEVASGILDDHEAKSTRRIAPSPTPVALTLPKVVLRNQDNQEVRLYEDLLKDRIFLINMLFVACPDGQCSLVTANLSRVQSLLGGRLGNDIFMYSISLDPVNDRPELLKAYSTHFNRQPGWSFLTGEKSDDIEQLRKALGYWDPDPKVDALKTSHTGVAVMGNEPLDRWVHCPTLAEPREIKRVLGYLDWPKGWSKSESRIG